MVEVHVAEDNVIDVDILYPAFSNCASIATSGLLLLFAGLLNMAANGPQ
jgi:hypothetical protein